MKIMTMPAMADALARVRGGDLAGAAARLREALGGRGGALPGGAAAAPTMARARRVPAREAPEPGGGRFEERAYSGAAGSLGFKLYTPAGLAAGAPLVVMLHGCTQTPEDFARGTGMNRWADRLGFAVAYPRQTRERNANGCWNWFEPGCQARGAGEPALIAGATAAALAETRGDGARVFVAGLSAGGAAAAVMAATYPDVYAGVGVHSGLAAGAARDVAGAFRAMRTGAGAAAAGRVGGRFVPLITVHGDADATVAEANAAAIVGAAAAAAGRLSTLVETGGGAGGRAWTRAVMRDADGRVRVERWTVNGLGHAWSGGDAAGSYADPDGPDASGAMARFFLGQARAG